MNTSSFDSEGLTIDAELRPTKVILTLKGIGDARAPGEFFDGVVRTVVASIGARTVEIDVRGLEYMNSGAVAALVTMVKTFDTKGVPTHLKFDATVNWQRVNAQCMRVVARCLKQVSVEA